MATNSFRAKKFEDHEIVDNEGKVVGHIRVKPSGVHWCPRNAKIWYGINLEKFASFMEEYGSAKKN